MNDRGDMRVVEVEYVRAHRIQRRGIQHVHALVAADDRRVTAGTKAPIDANRLIDHRIARARECHGEVVDECALRFVTHLARNVAPLRRTDDTGQRLRHGNLV